MPVERNDRNVILKHPKGPLVEILFYGATIISWKDTAGAERLFVSSNAALDGSKPVRGGIPVVFPCFGAPEHPEHSRLSQHGFARNSTWSWGGLLLDNNDDHHIGAISVKLTLEPTPQIKQIYDPEFKLAYVITLSEHQLKTSLHVTNASTSAPLEFQALFHTYIRAPANEVLIYGLKEKYYHDKTKATPEGHPERRREQHTRVDVKSFTDSVYEDAPGKYDVTWPGGGIVVKSSHNLKNVVIWNPQDEAGRKIGDMEAGGWVKFVCVEPGHVRGFVRLQAGEFWIGHQTLDLLEPISHPN